jgi:hypothetical protein
VRRVIEAAKKWVSEGRRSIDIHVGDLGDNKSFRIWAYDYDLMGGQYVNSIEEIDIKAFKEKAEREKYEQLKKKYE